MAKANEMLQGMRLLKLYGWETLFGNKVKDLRKVQLKLLIKAACMASILSMLILLVFHFIFGWCVQSQAQNENI